MNAPARAASSAVEQMQINRILNCGVEDAVLGVSRRCASRMCAQGLGVAKGGLFHHFKSKEALAIEAAAHVAGRADQMFSAASLSG